jgi:hypothetical protein
MVGCCVPICHRVSHVSSRRFPSRVSSHVASVCCVASSFLPFSSSLSFASCRHSRIASHLVSSRLAVSPHPPIHHCGPSHCIVVDCCVVIVARRPSPLGWLLCSSALASRRVASYPLRLLRYVSLLHCVVVAHRPPLSQPHSSSSSLRRRRGGSGNVSPLSSRQEPARCRSKSCR